MAQEFGSGWTARDDLADINIVPLVDVLLVLLVIFMITAPIITHSLDVQLPRASLSPGTRTDQTLIISVDHQGTLAVNQKVLGPLRDKATIDRFDRAIHAWKAANPSAPAFLRADRRLRYGTVIQIMAQLRRLGVIDVGLMIEREAS
ncbi:MAG TPA: biopolymer transporter ExbD [bacterium]|nr:biopolymer transporter ExbD [bacterium]